MLLKLILHTRPTGRKTLALLATAAVLFCSLLQLLHSQPDELSGGRCVLAYQEGGRALERE